MKEKILVAEDNPENMLVIEMTLSTQRYTLLKATDGEEALEMAMRELPDLILMDVQLPKLNGLEVTRKLRERSTLNHPIIIGITAYAMKGDKEKTLESGCDAYMSKPFSPRELRGMIAEMLSQRQKYKPGFDGDSRDQEGFNN
ncbi:response regulator [Chloroflexota bacterium]